MAADPVPNDILLHDDWVVTYDENGVVWLEGIGDPSKRIALEHGVRLNMLTPDVPLLHCALCDKELKPVFPQHPHGNQDGILRFAFSGGYGEFVDYVSGPIEGMMCKECAIQLTEAMPKLGEILRNSL